MNRRKITRTFLSSAVLLALLIAAQVGFAVLMILLLGSVYSIVYQGLLLLSALIVIWLIMRDDVNPSYKEMWIILVLGLPPMGAVFYLFWGSRSTINRHARRFQKGRARLHDALPGNEALAKELPSRDLARGAVYLQKTAGAPLFGDTRCTYYPLGDSFYPDLLAALRGAQKCIFMEYFILEPGQALDPITAILKEKALQGLDVRLIFDYFGCMTTLPRHFAAELRASGVKVQIYAPVHLSLHVSDYLMLNHRNHRKITVVDGEIGFSGGVNLADEYFNLRTKFGHWKDTAFRLAGSGVLGLTTTFLEDWDYLSGEESSVNAFAPTPLSADALPAPGDACLVQPYGDSPLMPGRVMENAYLNILQQAERYVTIITPYLIIDHEMLSSLCRAAQSGIEVRIIVPGVPDKKLIYWASSSFFPSLLLCGVRIFEYTPGFCHAKMFLADDRVAVVGSANMDFRSLCLHSENACVFYGGNMVREVKADLDFTLAQCREVLWERVLHTPLPVRLIQVLLRVFSPLF